MDLRYFSFCVPGSPFYDRAAPESADADSDLQDLAPTPDGWTRGRNSEWTGLTPPGYDMPEQGWKIHVSATPGSAAAVLAAVHDYCRDNAVAYKFVSSQAILLRRNSKYGDRSASGKFVTLYPVDDDEFALVLDELDAHLTGQPGPYILSDLRFRSGPLYVRYGGFVDRVVLGPDGTTVHCIRDPEGRWVPDVRGPGFRPPEWVCIPECLQPALAARQNGTLRDFPYRVHSALHFSNGGGVYRATETTTGEPVLLKEARPLAGLDEDGADAVTRLAREHWALEKLRGLNCVPRDPVYRRGHEHQFLAREFVDGRSLFAAIFERNPLVNPDAVETPAEYTAWALRVLAGIERGIDEMHRRGVVFGDLHPNNVLVRDDDSVCFIDFETSSDPADARPQAIGAPGFRAPAGYRGTAVDRYALGCLRIALFLPVTVVLPWSAGKVRNLLRDVAREFPLPDGFDVAVWRDLGADAYPEAADATSATRSAGQAVWPAVARGSWPRLRARLIDDLLAAATRDRSDRLFPGDIEQFSAMGGVNLAHGAAGVLWVAQELGAAVPDECVDWLTAAADRESEPAPGLWNGLAGVALALDQLGRPDVAADLLDRVRDLPVDDGDRSLWSGLAGVALAELELSGTVGGASGFAAAVDLGRRLVDTPARPGGRTGLLRGESGPALLFVRLFEATGERRWLDAARSAVVADLTAAGWDPDAAPEAAAHATWRTPVLAAGGAGPALVLADLLRHAPDDRLDGALTCVRASLRGRFLLHAGLFTGRAGAVLALQRTAGGPTRPAAADAAALRRHVRAFGWHAVRCDGRLAFLGDQSLRLSTDLATGTAGVLLALESVLGSSAMSIPGLADRGRPASAATRPGCAA